MNENSDMPVRHLYVHIPFCARICPFCAFYKEQAAHADKDRFCDALVIDAERTSDEFPFALETIYLGGGTPTSLTTFQLGKIVRALSDHFDVSGVREWTIEANPGSVSPEKARLLRDAGVSRVSLGVQSWNDRLLRLLGREHDAAQARHSYDILRAAGFANINIDLMFALPTQSEADWRESLAMTINAAPEHISTYCLTYEEDTDFLARFETGEFRRDENDEADFFGIATELLTAGGHEQYEISNFARPGFRSVHNEAYWAGEDYIALGPGAFATRGLKRWRTVPDHREYARRIFAGESTSAQTEPLTTAMKRTERIALGLRTREGIAASLVDDQIVADLVTDGFVRLKDQRVVLTPSGSAVADSVTELLT